MSNKLISKLTFVIIVLVVICVIVSIISDHIKYNQALDCVCAGNYVEARKQLEPMSYGYRDREALLDYIDIMELYDPADSANVYRSYRTLCCLVDEAESETISSWIEATRQTVSMSYYALLGQTNGLG